VGNQAGCMVCDTVILEFIFNTVSVHMNMCVNVMYMSRTINIVSYIYINTIDYSMEYIITAGT